MSQRGMRKEREGVVTSNRMRKTVVVSIERKVKHPRYKKFLKRWNKVKAHDEKDECQVGDRVLIVECQPMSREKRWRVCRTLVRAVATDDEKSAVSNSSPVL
ncbi:MAG: 30S ribosomal protein S17 [Candidatus Binatia bacterium]